MSEGTVKKIMYVNRKAPYGTIYALESLEAAAGREGASPGEIEPLVERINTQAASLASLAPIAAMRTDFSSTKS